MGTSSIVTAARLADGLPQTISPRFGMARHLSLALRVVAIVVILSACHAKDPYRDDLQMMCDAPTRAPKAGAVDAPGRAREMATWIDAQPKTDQAKKFFSDLIGKSPTPAAKGAALREEAKRAGVTGPCALADWYDQTAKALPAPAEPSSP
jgi:hypothetical protein